MPFRLEEATIDDLHAAIRAGEISCVQVVQHYLDRARAYNGVASVLVTEDGMPVDKATGVVRAGAPLVFPTETVAARTLLPDLDKYRGAPLELGRMEATASDPTVQQQYGMITGIPDAGQVNALATLNIRGERSVTCRGEFDRHPCREANPASTQQPQATAGSGGGSWRYPSLMLFADMLLSCFITAASGAPLHRARPRDRA